MTRTLWDKLPYACGRKEERYGKDLRFLPIEKKTGRTGSSEGDVTMIFAYYP